MIARFNFLLMSAFSLIAGMIISGCFTTHDVSPFQTNLDSLGVTTNQVRLANYERCRRIAIVIEHAADSIIALSQDPKIAQASRSWKSSAVPAFRQILLFEDPIAAALDGFAYAVQMHQYFVDGEGRTMFGDLQPIARRCAENVRALFPATTDEQRIVTSIESWARQHQIQNELFDRASIIPDLKQLQLGSETSVGGAVGDISLEIRDLSDRLNLMAMQIPREARWQVEYLLAETNLGMRIDSLEMRAGSIAQAAARLQSAIRDGDIRVEVRSLERLHSDIAELEKFISDERSITLKDIDRQRIETLRDLEHIATTSLQTTAQAASDMIDRLMMRFTVICAVGFLLGGVLAMVIVQLRNRRSQNIGSEH